MALRRRNISWRKTTDAVAEQLARAKGFKGGVSELLEKLVHAEKGRKVGLKSRVGATE